MSEDKFKSLGKLYKSPLERMQEEEERMRKKRELWKTTKNLIDETRDGDQAPTTLP